MGWTWINQGLEKVAFGYLKIEYNVLRGRFDLNDIGKGPFK